jgi:NAD(P)-dependent dehydrogenase (short-subunit alcohol dehydrogenase family)
MSARVAIVTNVFDVAGPPAVDAVTAQGFATLCHAQAFADPDARAAFEAQGPNRIASAAQTPEDLAREALERYGRIDVAIANDVGDPSPGPLAEKTAQDYRALLESFAVAPFRLAAAVLPTMQAQGGGRIIFVTSSSGLKASPNMVLYSAARAATHALVKSLAVEAAPFGVSVNAIAPLVLLSNFFPGGADDPELARLADRMIPMKRYGRPDELAGLIGLLASGTADYISGQVIAFSGAGA